MNVGSLLRSSQTLRWIRSSVMVMPVGKGLGQGTRAANTLLPSLGQSRVFSSTTASIQESFHKRALPSTLVAMSSALGKERFREALEDGHMESFFPLSEQFITQSEPAFCSLSSMAMVLNALNHDPGRVWKGPWRWITEETLQCETQDICGHSLQSVRERGMCFSEFESLAACHGVNMRTFRVTDQDQPWGWAAVERGKVKEAGQQQPQSQQGVTPPAVKNEKPGGGHIHDHTCTHTHTHSPSHGHGHNHSPDPSQHQHQHGLTLSSAVSLSDERALAQFRQFITDSASSATQSKGIVISNFSRQALDQTGDGHFSPLAGYHRASDSVLVMDTARFKYPPWWVPVSQLWRAMGVPDALTGEPRGYFVVERSSIQPQPQPKQSQC